MPLFVEKIEPVKELQKIEIQPAVTKVEKLRAPLLALCLFVFKLGIISIFAYCGYILMIQ